MKKIFQNTPDEKFNEMISTMENKLTVADHGIEAIMNDKADKLDVIMKFWPYIKPVLSIAKVFTNDKIDALIDAVIAWGNEYVKNEEE